jgi:hypothetical protein
MNKLLLAVLGASLCACASTSPQQERLGSIAATPLKDFNLSDTTIPPILLQAKAKPYAAPLDQACPKLMDEVSQLDEVLGPDLDAPEAPEESKTARATQAVSNAAMGAVQRTVEGAIPFRGWVRKLSGAERQSREVAAAIAAGTVRRGFLKGVALAHSCAPLPVKASVVAR